MAGRARSEVDVARRRRLAITACMGLGVAIPVVLGALEVERLEREGLVARTELHADHIAARFDAAARLRLDLLEGVARDLAEGRIADADAFDARVRALVTRFPDLQAVNWLDQDAVAQWVSPLEDNAAVAGRDLDELATASVALGRARTRGRPATTRIIPLVQGGAGFAAYFPLEGGPGGFLNGVVSLGPFLASLVPPELRDAVEVELLPSDAPLRETDPLRSERSLGFLGEAFVLSVRPGPDALEGRRLSAGLLLGFGFFLAGLSARLVHELLSSRERAAAHEAHRHALLAAVPDHVIRLGPDRATLAYHRPSELTPLRCHHPPRQWIPARLLSAIERASAEGRIVENEVELDGRSFEARIAPEADGHVVLSLRDVSERRRLEAERTLLAQLVESSAQLAAVVGANGRVEYMNPAGRAMLGIQDPRELALEAFLNGPRGLLAPVGGGRAWSGRLELRGADDTRIPAQVASFTVFTARGPKLGLLALDLRETAELERRLLQSQKLEAVGTLAAGVAHDFNNALSVFRTGIELLESTPDMPPRALEDLELMRTAATSAAHVASQLLAFARPSSGREVRFEVDGTLRAAARMFERALPDDVALVWDLGAPGVEIDGEPAALQQVVLNLVVNARDALDEGGRITISSRVVGGSSGEAIEVGVEDDGKGMSDVQRERAFDPFFTTKAHGAGTGLGLPMVKRVTESFGGEVELESESGVGTKAILRIPATRARRSPTSSASGQPRPRPAARVILADDDDGLRTLVRRALERAGHEVREAATGPDALALLTSEVGVLIADSNLPGMDGHELARRARRAHHGVRVVLLSGRASNGPRSLETRSGVTWLTKPITPSALIQYIDDPT